MVVVVIIVVSSHRHKLLLFAMYCIFHGELDLRENISTRFLLCYLGMIYDLYEGCQPIQQSRLKGDCDSSFSGHLLPMMMLDATGSLVIVGLIL